MLAHVQRGPWNGYTVRQSGEWYRPVICPECGNFDDDNFVLYSTDLDICRWYSNGVDRKTGVVWFDYGKSVHVESSEMPDTLMCLRCDHEFDATGYAYDLQ